MSPRNRPRREVQPRLVDLGAELRRTRLAMTPRPTQSDLGRRLTWGQDRVSLLESGRQTPTEQDIVAWAGAVGVDPQALLALRENALTRRIDIREAARRPEGANAMQGDLENLEAGSTVIAEYQPDLIPGLVQTPDYTRAWLSQPGRIELGDPVDVDDVINRRAARQRQAETRQVVVAVQPAALRAVYGTVEVQIDQLDDLIHRAKSSGLDLIVARRAVALLHGFELLDDAAVIETVAGLQVMAAPEVVAQFRAALTRIRRGGATGPSAIRELERARRILTG